MPVFGQPTWSSTRLLIAPPPSRACLSRPPARVHDHPDRQVQHLPVVGPGRTGRRRRRARLEVREVADDRVASAGHAADGARRRPRDPLALAGGYADGRDAAVGDPLLQRPHQPRPLVPVDPEADDGGDAAGELGLVGARHPHRRQGPYADLAGQQVEVGDDPDEGPAPAPAAYGRRRGRRGRAAGRARARSAATRPTASRRSRSSAGSRCGRAARRAGGRPRRRTAAARPRDDRARAGARASRRPRGGRRPAGRGAATAGPSSWPTGSAPSATRSSASRTLATRSSSWALIVAGSTGRRAEAAVREPDQRQVGLAATGGGGGEHAVGESSALAVVVTAGRALDPGRG